MKIYISNYRNSWLSPYIILEKFFFWRKGYDAHEKRPPEWLQSTMEGISSIIDTIYPRIEFVKIDKYDTWNMDHTLALIILPMLKELKQTKQGAPFTNDEDVPEILKSSSAPKKENEYDTDANHFLRWEYILGEMIWTFEQYNIDWEDQYRSGVSDWEFGKLDDGNSEMVKGPNHTREYDWDGIKKHQARMANGFRLFGCYYQNLWD